MSWSASINASPYKTINGTTVVDMVFTDGISQKISQVLPFSDVDSLKATVQNILDQYIFHDTVPAKLPLGPFDPTPTPPTSAQQARSAYAKDVELLGQMNRAIAAGAKKSTDQDYLDVTNRVKTNFIDSYIDLF